MWFVKKNMWHDCSNVRSIKKKKQNHRQKYETAGEIDNQNDSFGDQMESRNNEKCLFSKQQHN